MWLPLLGGVAVLVAIAAVLLTRDVLTVRDALHDAQASLLEVREAAGSIEVETASAALERADEELSTARSRSGGPLWSFASRLPVVGDSLHTTRNVVRVTSAAVAVADRAVVDGEGLLGQGLEVRAEDGQLDLAPLVEAGTILESLPLDELVTARDRLLEEEPHWAPGEVLEGRQQALTMATDTIETIQRGRALLSALPGFLGTDEPRRYFLGVQTPAELRGTGGLIGYYAVLGVEEGRFELGSSEVYDALDDVDEGPETGNIGQLSGDITQGVTADAEFEERYANVAATGLFSNVNVDPDLPTTAAVALDLYEERTGERLDGMILVDPVAMEGILAAVGGDIEVPAELAPSADLPATVSPARFAEFATVDVYDELGEGDGAARKQLLRGIGDIAFARVFDGQWDGVAVSRAISNAAGEKHVQVFSRDEEEQEAFERVGVTGRLTVPEQGDVLSVTANNAVGGKQDVHLGHRVVGEVVLGDPRRSDDDAVTVTRDTSLRVEVDNPLPSEGMDLYVIGNCLVGQAENECFEGPPGENRTWFTTWVPGEASLVEASGDDRRFGVRSGRIRGFTVFDRFLETPSQDVEGFDLAIEGEAPARVADGHLVYDLTWWAQAKAVPTALDLTVVAPDGWRVADVQATGGGTGQGFGPYGEGEPLTAEVDDGRARLTGTVTGDVDLQVRMSDAES